MNSPAIIESPSTLSASDRENFVKIAQLFKVFSDASRLMILHILKSGPKSVGELVQALGTTQANISKHLRIIHEANILNREKHGTSVIYSIDDAFVLPLCELACTKLNCDKQELQNLAYTI
jgi:DNA-binding transcriptional ArsR family regulator